MRVRSCPILVDLRPRGEVGFRQDGGDLQRVVLGDQPLEHRAGRRGGGQAAIKGDDFLPSRVVMLAGERLGVDPEAVALVDRPGRQVFLEREVGEGEDPGATFEQQPGPVTNVLEKRPPAVLVSEHGGEGRPDLIRLVLRRSSSCIARATSRQARTFSSIENSEWMPRRWSQ